MNLLLALKYIKTLLKSLILPPSGSLLLAFAGLLLLRRYPRLGRTFIGIGVASLWLLSTPVIADWITRPVEHFPPLNLSQPTQAQAIVILGGGGQRDFAPEYGGAEAEPYLLERLAYGAYVARKTGLPILVTGFHDEARTMHDTLERHFGIDARWVDDQSYDTFENARNSVRMLHADGIDRVILVTRATHLWRASREFLAAGIQVVPAPVGMLSPRDRFPFRYVPDSQALMRSNAAIYEALGECVRQLLAITHLRHQ